MARSLYDKKEPWMEEAHCAGNEDLFFPPSYPERGLNKEVREARAKAFCAVCVVKDECLEFGLSNKEQGILGGTNEEEREQMRIEKLNQLK